MSEGPRSGSEIKALEAKNVGTRHILTVNRWSLINSNKCKMLILLTFVAGRFIDSLEPFTFYLQQINLRNKYTIAWFTKCQK